MKPTPSDEVTETPDNRSTLERLNSGLLMLGLKRSVDDAAYYVIDRQTYGHSAIYARHTYSAEVIRVLDDLKLTAHLTQKVSEVIQADNKEYLVEDQIAYYNGVFYSLTHSLKDKVIQLVAVMLAEEQLPKAYKALKEAKVQKFLDKNQAVLKDIGIYTYLEEWLDTHEGVIGKTLRRRNDYHHGPNRQQLGKDQQNLKLARLMQQPSPDAQLTDYGKQKMKKLEAEALQNIIAFNKEFQSKVLETITTNINNMSEKLIGHFKVPTDMAELVGIGADYTTFLSSLKIKNVTGKDKIQPETKEMIDDVVEAMPLDIKGDVISIYLAGSAARGEFKPDISDLNFYIITSSFTRVFDDEMPVTMHILTEKDLMTRTHQKDRFIIWSDGLLLKGKPIKFSEKDFPKPGMALCMLLNEGVIEKLKALQDELRGLINPTEIELRLFSLKAVRTMMDYDYGVAMSNRPMFTASRKEKLIHTKTVFPDGRRTDMLAQIYYGAKVNVDNLSKLIDAFLENAQTTYEHMLNILNEDAR